MSQYLCDANPPVCSLAITEAWAGLTNDEKLYTHHLSRACWAGARIIMAQTSPQAEPIFDFIIAFFEKEGANGKLADLEALKQKAVGAGVKEEEWNEVVEYCAQVLSNLSNIKSFGATKFIPRVAESAFTKVVHASSNSRAIQLYNAAKDFIYSTSPTALLSLGKPSAGHLSGYYPITDSKLVPVDEEIDEVQRVCDAAGVSTLNTRLSKKSASELILHIASASSSLPASFPQTIPLTLPTHFAQTLLLEPGDFSSHLTAVNASLAKAAEATTDENRRGMLRDYQKSFDAGDVEDHKEGSRKWVKDVGPVVENYIGFIESYQDPYGGRAEWEGFVAVVNKEQSKKFNTLVDQASTLIKDLPWGKDFEVTTFQRPDFTSLEIVSFCTGGIPAGINIPNYHDVREHDGFKNVSLSNILSAKAAGEQFTFIAPEEIEAYEKWEGKAFEVQVANHELLGHGTGKLLQELPDGTFNFDRSLINPLTGKVVDSWYKPGETYGSKVGPVSSSMEECRAEAVALYLASNREILKIFKFETDEDADQLLYFTFLVMARAGVRALEWYDPTTKKHGQAHMEARLGITQWLISHSIVSIEEVRSETGELVDAYARVNREELRKNGKSVMGKLLLEIQVRKSLGDGKGATEFYKKLTTPSDDWVRELRPLVIKKKLPRKIFVQPTTEVVKGEVVLREFPVTCEGVIESFVVRGL